MQPGTLIGNEKNLLSAVGIQAGQLLILEVGQVELLNVRFSVDNPNYRRIPYNIQVPRGTTVSEWYLITYNTFLETF